ncbi:GntR family transcriptional regulator [Peterkaempfera bronchialis]|uniref:GntR family transcriptional regulator n=1 Tax=Peterkaempfera bronchialis TaxID=2126346 RepID=A0A345STU4_9ACTN|nr:GntR family transcriptional regulator [Peterkaempfera bronchialis]AXI77149.1 GntR family transcriptional regulator [Peterkaempfera bronchialis]
MQITVDPSSPVPPYEQIRARIAELARSGELPTGHRLPAVRALAAELGLAANTVARAYRELEADGAVETRGRHGTVIAAAGDAAHRRAAAAAEAYAERARHLGLTPEEALRAVTTALRVAYGESEQP